MKKHIIPRYKLILYYDPDHSDMETYYQFVMNEMIPAVQAQGLYMFRVFHTLWGDCPMRQAEFVAEDLDTIHGVLNSDKWHAIEAKLSDHVTNYQRKIVKFRPGFQL